MARLKLDIPDTLPFCTLIAVRVGDINHGKHVGNDKMLGICQEGRALLFNEIGIPEMDLSKNTFVVGDAALIFKSESFYGQTLKVEIGVSSFRRSGMDLLYRISDNSTGKDVALAKTSMVCFDFGKRKSVSFSEEYKDLFRHLLVD